MDLHAAWSGMQSFAGKDGTISWYLYSPPTIAAGMTYPLVLFLHGGVGSNGVGGPSVPQDAFYRPDHAQQMACFVLRPVAIKGTNWVSPRGKDHLSHVMPAEPSTSMKIVIELLDQVVKANPIDGRQVHVTGASMGGYGTWDIIQRFPERFASAVPICGGGDPALANRIKGLRIWLFHCADDNVVNVRGSRDLFAALVTATGEIPTVREDAGKIEKSLAGGRIVYTEYRKGAHFSWDKAYREASLIAWMQGK